MHSNLAKNLHSEECIKFIDEYEKCNKDNKYLRYVGVCNDLQNKMASCIRKELINRRNLGSENVKKRELDNYIKKNPQLGEKLKQLEELKARQKEKPDNQTETQSTKSDVK